MLWGSGVPHLGTGMALTTLAGEYRRSGSSDGV